jgi:threonine-phosphate decarboxylase
MLQKNHKIQSEKYKFISGQYGGYYRHDFIDHAYLYNLYFPPEDVFTKFKDNIHNLVLNYPVGQDELAGLMGKIIDQPAKRIVVGNGASELIKILSGHISSRLIVPVPSFNEYANAAPSGRVVQFPLEYPSFELDIDKFIEKAVSVKADVAVVVSPNNPTSMIIPKNDLVRLAGELESHGCMLVIDESFLDFADNPGSSSMEKQIENFANLAILKSMSKAYGICGLRIGYLLTANLKFAQKIRQGLHIWNVNGFAEEFLRILPSYTDEFTESCEKVRCDRDSFYKKLCKIKGMKVYKPDANFVFCRLPDPAKSAGEITKKLFIEHNIYIKDCAGKVQAESDRYLRIASRTEIENSRLVEALTAVLNS